MAKSKITAALVRDLAAKVQLLATEAEACEMVGISTTTLNVWMKRGAAGDLAQNGLYVEAWEQVSAARLRKPEQMLVKIAAEGDWRAWVAYLKQLERHQTSTAYRAKVNAEAKKLEAEARKALAEAQLSELKLAALGEGSTGGQLVVVGLAEALEVMPLRLQQAFQAWMVQQDVGTLTWRRDLLPDEPTVEPAKAIDGDKGDEKEGEA